jgi:hypothetical protein
MQVKFPGPLGGDPNVMFTAALDANGSPTSDGYIWKVNRMGTTLWVQHAVRGPQASYCR